MSHSVHLSILKCHLSPVYLISNTSFSAKNYNELNRTTLESAINSAMKREVPGYDPSEREWPNDVDVLKAFSVFDQDGNGSIPVQQLKRFLLQAQLDIQEEERECHTHLIHPLVTMSLYVQVQYHTPLSQCPYMYKCNTICRTPLPRPLAAIPLYYMFTVQV